MRQVSFSITNKKVLVCPLLSFSLLLGAASLVAQTAPNFGPNVTVITPGMTPAQVTSALNAVNQYSQFDTRRSAVLLMPGSYGTPGNSVYADVGYYESIAGLGVSPNQVTITGGLVADQLISGNLTQNFWRSQENLTEIPVGGESSGTLDWGVSQGASLRRLNIQGGLTLVNSNGCNESSGGFTADTVVSGITNACSQQQWYTRNSVIPPNGWQSNVWNFVFSGVTNAPAQHYPGASPGNGITTLATTPVSREKPFLYVDNNGNWWVFSPALKMKSSGISWSGGLGTGTSLPISTFYIATPSSTLTQINQALTGGQNLILTPGIYQYSGPIKVTKANTVVLGMGYATIVPQSGGAALTVSDVDGVQVAGLLIDAGPVNSPVLLEVGNLSGGNAGHAVNPTSLNDVFFRVGGATLGKATTALQVDSGDVILDNIWSWRADHGNPGTTGWTVNTAAHGLVVNGNNVIALGLAVEHYQQSQVQWNGNGGETIFYQSELPYDPPSQTAWMNGTANGYPSYVVAPAVCTHTAYGLGIYSYFNLGVNIIDDNAMTAPNTTGVAITDVGSVWLGGSGQITHVIDGTGGTASSPGGVLEPVPSYLGTGTCNATPPPAAPTGLQATNEPPIGSNPNPYVELTWTASTTPGVTYNVYRATGSGIAASIMSGITVTNYADNTVIGSTTYTYYVVSVDSAGSSGPSNSQTLTTGAAEVSPPTNLVGVANGSQINLTWTASATSGVTYSVYRATGSGPFSSLQAGIVSTSYVDSAVVSGTTYVYYVVAVTISGSVSAESNTQTVQAGSTHSPDVVAINAGSTAAVGTFAADAYCPAGATYDPGKTVTIPAAIAGIAAPEGVYQSACQGTITYAITGLTAGNAYTVVLHFAELYFGSAGSRVFNVAINGTPVPALQNFDIVKAAGAGLTAVIETVPNIPATGGRIVISFTNGAVNQPMINGIEIQGVAGPPPPPTGVSINSGGGATGGFLADIDVTGGGEYAPGIAVTIPPGTLSAAPVAVYEDARQGASTYTIGGFANNSPGHTVTLHFAELYFPTAGSRKFNVAINGTPVPGLQNFDIVAAAGGKNFTTVVKQLTNITASATGQVVINFTNGSVDQPMINGIVVQ